MNPVSEYVNSLRSVHGSGQATEHSYRACLQSLLQTLDAGIEVINEPKHLDFGAPDLVLRRNGQPIGYVECKDLPVELDAVADGEQLERYRVACDNLLLTNYREFRWYRGGEPDGVVSIARLGADGLRPRRPHYDSLNALLGRFQRAAPGAINSPEELARVMADQTSEIAKLISETLNTPGRRSFLHRHKHDLEMELLPTLSVDEFADMYAQTLAYALFAARMELQRLPPRDFTLARAFADMPRTNRFLHREFGQIFQDLEREVKWAVEQLTTRLAHTQIAEVMRDFRGGTRQRDAIVHFYEDFLATHDPVMREQRGVYFTPEPVVGYIVRSVDALLRSHFARADGLASDDVHILDPAVGTGSFLLRVVQQIHETMRGQRGIWPEYVRQRLLPRLHGFELLMAPYTLAHMRLGLYLGETGVTPGEEDRLRIYLTNSLDKGETREEHLWEDHIVAEANAAAAVKNEKPIMVVLGNPPYSGNSANRGAWIRDLLRDYYQVDGAPLGEKNPKMLQDDYVKFLRFGQWRIERNGEGVLAFITNHGWLDNVTFRGMRQSLLNSFSEIYVLDLHGNSKKKEVTPEGNKDENVFNIQQGVSIAFFIKRKGVSGPARVYHADLWGLRREKYKALNAGDIRDTDWQELEPRSPNYFLRPFDYRGWDEYQSYWKITDVFPVYSSGIKTSRDAVVFDFDEETLRERIAEFRDKSIHDEELRLRYKGLNDRHAFRLSEARAALVAEENWEQFIQRCLYRPFDVRPLFYHPKLVEGARQDVMRHMLRGNIEQMSGGGIPDSSPSASSRSMAPGHSPESPTPPSSPVTSPTRPKSSTTSSPSGSMTGAASDDIEQMSGGGIPDLSPSARWPKGISITSSSANRLPSAASPSAAGDTASSSRSTSTSGQEPGAHHHADDAGPVGRKLQPEHHESQELRGLRHELPLPPVSTPPKIGGVNLALMTARGIERRRRWDQALCTQTPAILHALSLKEGNFLLPLYLHRRGRI